MTIKRYRVAVINLEIITHLLGQGQSVVWWIAANNMQSAWRKFCRQHFGVLGPDPSDYDISVERERMRP